MLKAVLTFSPLELCDRGEYEAAAESAGLRVGQWPENDSGGNLTHAERLLVAGIITSVIGGIQQSADQAVARDMLNESIRLFADDDRAWVARSWLARAEYWAGNLDQALALADEVLTAPLGAVTKFRTLLTKASVYSDRDLPDEAMSALGEMIQPYESLDPLFKGQFHNQRGRVLRLMGATDRAVLEYDCAIYFFQEAGNVRCQAIAATNLAGIYLEIGQFERAHDYAEQAGKIFSEIGDRTYEAMAWDQAALIYLAESKLEDAGRAIAQAISLVNDGDVLNRCSETLEKIRGKCGSIRREPHPVVQPRSPIERSMIMLPLDYASQLIQDQPDKALLLYDFLVQVRAAQDDPQYKLELDAAEEMLYAKTEHFGNSHEGFRRSRLRLVREVISDS